MNIRLLLRKTIRYITAFAVCLSVVTGVVLANDDGIPTSLSTALSNRDKAYAHTTFNWSLQESLTAGDHSEDRQNAASSIPELVREDAKKQGVTDESVIQTRIRQALSNINLATYAYSVNQQHDWMFVRNDSSTMVSGGVASIDDSGMFFHQYYEPGQCIVVNDLTESKDGKQLMGMPVYVVAFSSDGRMVYNPIQQALDATPEDFSLLAGVNPLSMFLPVGAKWRLIDNQDNEWVIQTQVNKGQYSPFTLTVKLSKLYGDAPVECDFKNGIWQFSYIGTAFEQHNGQWICTEMTNVDNRPGIRIRKRVWRLTSVKDSEPYAIAISLHKTVMDYRLLGNDLITHNIVTADQSNAVEKQIYFWDGKLPPLTGLQKASPQRVTVYTLLLGSICLIVAIVLLRVRRRTQASILAK